MDYADDLYISNATLMNYQNGRMDVHLYNHFGVFLSPSVPSLEFFVKWRI